MFSMPILVRRNDLRTVQNLTNSRPLFHCLLLFLFCLSCFSIEMQEGCLGFDNPVWNSQLGCCLTMFNAPKAFASKETAVYCEVS